MSKSFSLSTLKAVHVSAIAKLFVVPIVLIIRLELIMITFVCVSPDDNPQRLVIVGMQILSNTFISPYTLLAIGVLVRSGFPIL
jgi:hypothetical protein